VIVLYDGWPLVYSPTSPAALHLLTLLEACPPGVRPWVALPAPARVELPPAVETRLLPEAGTPAARLGWEQRRLPRLARELGAGLLHLVSLSPPLFPSVPVLASPAGEAGWPLPHAREGAGPRSLAGRLRAAAAGGGMARLGGLLWPADLPAALAAPGGAPLLSLPPAVHPLFAPDAPPSPPLPASLNLPETYVLYHGPGEEADLHRLLQTWSWAAGPVGAFFPLVLAGLDAAARARLEALLPAYDLVDTVLALPELDPPALAALYRGCQALLHPAPSAPWESPLRLALALGRPAAALETPIAAAQAGPGAYLAPWDPGGRALGAALITLIVEEDLARQLSEAALQRSAAWDLALLREALGEVYETVSTGGKKIHR